MSSGITLARRIVAAPPGSDSLKSKGLKLAEIASRTGLHESSVRRILYNLARQYAEERKPASPEQDEAR